MNDDSKHTASTLGLIAGGGSLPRTLIQHCLDTNRNIFVVALEGTTHMDTTQGVPHIWCPIGKVGRIISALKENEVDEVIMVGGVKRPNFQQLVPDMHGMKLIAKLTAEIGQGDDALLKTVIGYLESQGFNVVGIDSVLESLLTPKGVITKSKPDGQAERDISLGKQVASALGSYDVGQAVVVDHGHVLGMEGPEGTEQLIARCKSLRTRDKASAVLVKMKKPGQESRVDLPSIGPDTVHQAHDAGITTIALQADATLLIEKESIVALANDLEISVKGV